MTTTGYVEICGERVLAVIRESSRPIGTAERGKIVAGSVLGLRSALAESNPVWLCEVIDPMDDGCMVIPTCIMGFDHASVWYGPPHFPGEFACNTPGVGDYQPMDYDVYAVLDSRMRGPPVLVAWPYLMISAVRAYVPLPFRRFSSHEFEFRYGPGKESRGFEK